MIGRKGHRQMLARPGRQTLHVNPQPGPSQRLVEQRVRNRVIEYLELASSFEAQQEYDRHKVIHVPNEVINQWEDWNPVDESSSPGRLASPYSDEEIEALRNVHADWTWVGDHTPNPLPELAEVQRLPAWQRLRDAAGTALDVFLVRGRMPDDDLIYRPRFGTRHRQSSAPQPSRNPRAIPAVTLEPPT
jgi:hypothetical protein